MEKSQTASLGCGTLILIALIVLFFSGGPARELKDDVKKLHADVRSLQSDVSSMKTTLNTQTILLQQMQQKLDKLQPPKENPAGR